MSSPATAATTAGDPVPPLEDGQRLGRAEFHRRYLASGLHRAELINGVVHVPSPMKLDHDDYSNLAWLWLHTWAKRNPGQRAGGSVTLRLFDDHQEFQPDAYLRRQEGRSVIGDDGYIYGPPELIVEVSMTTESKDRGSKRDVYRRAGVLEYIIVTKEAVTWLHLTGDADAAAYEQLPIEDGVIESRVFDGLRLDVEALLELDDDRLLAALG